MHTLTAIRLKYILPSQIFAECGEVTSLEIMLLHTWLPGSGVRWDKMKMIETFQIISFIHMIWWTAHSWRFSVLEFIGFDTQTRGMCTSTQSLNQVCGLFRYCKVIGYKQCCYPGQYSVVEAGNTLYRILALLRGQACSWQYIQHTVILQIFSHDP